MRKILTFCVLVVAISSVSFAQVIPQRIYVEPQIQIGDTLPDAEDAFNGLKYIDTSSGAILKYFYGDEWLPVTGATSIYNGTIVSQVQLITSPVFKVSLDTTYLKFPTNFPLNEQVKEMWVYFDGDEADIQTDISFDLVDTDDVSLLAPGSISTKYFSFSYFDIADVDVAVRIRFLYTDTTSETEFLEITNSDVANGVSVIGYDDSVTAYPNVYYEKREDPMIITVEDEGVAFYATSEYGRYYGAAEGSTVWDYELTNAILGYFTINTLSSGFIFDVSSASATSHVMKIEDTLETSFVITSQGSVGLDLASKIYQVDDDNTFLRWTHVPPPDIPLLAEYGSVVIDKEDGYGGIWWKGSGTEDIGWFGLKRWNDGTSEWVRTMTDSSDSQWSFSKIRLSGTDGHITPGVGVREVEDGTPHMFYWSGLVEHGDLEAAATSNAIVVATLPAKAVLNYALLEVVESAMFTDTYDVSVGVSGGYVDIIAAVDGKAAVGTVYGISDAHRGSTLPDADMYAFEIFSTSSTTDIYMLANGNATNIDEATAGEWKLTLVYSMLP